MFGGLKRIGEKLLGEIALVPGVLAVGLFDPSGGVLVRWAAEEAEATRLLKLGRLAARLFEIRAGHGRSAAGIDLAFDTLHLSARRSGGLMVVVSSRPKTDLSLVAGMGEDVLARAARIGNLRPPAAGIPGTL